VVKATKAIASGARHTPARPDSPTSRHVTPKPPTGVPAAPTVAGVRISHPDRLIYPDLGISKIQLARYYEEIADW
jgi:bifunctional non-homologous end joining protein LigD